MKRISLGLALHNHQPLGNFPWVFDDAYRHAYLPMIEELRKHPTIHASLHYSGCLMDWLAAERPEFLIMLKELARRGQVEIMGGAYYEPILPAIPDPDKHGQILKMSGFIEKEFDARPDGMWLAERVWEPYLARVLSEARIDWTLIDDTAFKMVGKADEDLFGYFLTEEQGHYLKVFPISKYLRYSIPWHEVGSVIEYLKSHVSDEGDKIAVLGDDGEKFGIWPETYEHCWERGWVSDFFKAVEDNSDWLSTIKLGDYIDRYPPAGHIYLPCASYDEMMEWSLPPQLSWEYTHLRQRLEDEGRADMLRYLYSGFWRNFMVKYPEVNRMHKKMLLVHNKVHRARSVDEAECGLDYLWRAQCNCSYWHGVFGGIYLTDIRAFTYSNLIKAENCADELLLKKDKGCNLYMADYDGDGKQEVLSDGREFNLYLSPHEGGSIIEWDLRKKDFNLLSTMGRRPEGYHRDLLAKQGEAGDSPGDSGIKSIHDHIKVKSAYTGGLPVYDTLPRSSLIDRFISAEETPESYEKNTFVDTGDFAGLPYECSISQESDTCINLKRRACVQTGMVLTEVILEKTITLVERESRLDIAYKFINAGKTTLNTIYGSEWNINLLGGGHNENASYRVEGREIGDSHLDSRGVIERTRELALANKLLGIRMLLNLDRLLTIWRYPVESLSNSEGGVEQVYQCSCLLILFPLHLEAGRDVGFQYSWSLKPYGL